MRSATVIVRTGYRGPEHERKSGFKENVGRLFWLNE